MPIQTAELLDRNPWHSFAKICTALCALAIVFDGFDITIVGFAIPAIAKDWHLPPSAFAPLLIIGLVGMTVGSTFAGVIGDKLGRRFGLSLCLLLFGIAIVASAFTSNLFGIELLRFIAAAGIGGALPTAATMSAEFTPGKMRVVAVMTTIVCVPLGGALAGSVAAALLPVSGWRALFLVGGIAPLLLAFVMLVVLPESPRYLSRFPERAPELVRLLARFDINVPADSTFVESAGQQPGQGTALADFFSRGQTRSTLSLWLAFFSSGASVYMCFSWLPTLLRANGLALGPASQGLAAYNYGGVVGVLCFAALVNRLGSRVLTLAASALAALTAICLVGVHVGTGISTIPLLATLAAHGFCVNAVQTSLFALGVHLYPTRVRATGVAVAAAMGRVGAIVSAASGPGLIHLGRAEFFEYLTIAMCVAFVGLMLLRNHTPSAGAETIAA